jgi:pimeloyl-ACP methyl ester carboxylesterase
MCPEAVVDLHALLEWARRTHGAQRFFFLSGSMGGTGNLIYATIHPEDVALLGALCPVTDIVAFYHWCRPRPDPLMDEVCRAMEAAYGGSPAQVPEKYARHVVVKHARRLTMPVLVAHALGDAVIPVEQPRALRQAMGEAPNLRYLEIPGGNHDTPLHAGGMIPWLEEQMRKLS